MDKIADAAGIGKASVYRIFKNKEELLDELLKKYYNEIVRNIENINSVEEDVLRQIKKMIAFWINFISENPVVYQLIHTEANPEGISNRLIYYDYLTSSLPVFKKNMISQNNDTKIKSVNFYSVFYGIMGYIDGIFIKWYRNDRQYNLRDEIPGIEEVLFHGILEKDQNI